MPDLADDLSVVSGEGLGLGTGLEEGFEVVLGDELSILRRSSKQSSQDGPRFTPEQRPKYALW